MFMRNFQYHTPSTVGEAVELLQKHGENAKILAGGQSLIPLMKNELIQPAHLIDIKRIKSLAYINEGSDYVLIGASTATAEIERSSILKWKCPLLPEAASTVASTQIRNKGTMVGSVCHADPAADLPTATLALDAEFKVEGPSGSRIIPSKEFFLDTFTTPLKPDEIMTEVKVPVHEAGFGDSYLKFSITPGDFAIVNVAVSLEIAPDGCCQHAAIALGGVANRTLRAPAAEEQLIGRRPVEELIQKVAEEASVTLTPPTDIKASGEYRRKMACIFMKRALRLAVKKAKSKP